MRSWYASILIGLLFTAQSFATPMITVVEAEGSGPSLNAAVEAAQRDAVEKAVGVLVGGETMVRNWQLMSDRIIAHSVGYIRKYDIIRRENGLDGTVKVTIRAEVNQIVDQLSRDKQARELLLKWLNVPRVTLALHEDLTGDTNSTVASEAMERAFINAGFSVLRAGDSTSASMDTAFADYDPTGELVLVGEADAHVGPTPAVMRRAGMISVQGHVRASLLLADTRDVLATSQKMVAAPHIDSTQAGIRALTAASRSVADSLISDVLTIWALQRANTLPLELVVNGVNAARRTAIPNQLAEIGGVRNVYERSWSDGRQTLMVEWEGTSGQLASDLEGMLLDGRETNVRSLSWGRVVVDLSTP